MITPWPRDKTLIYGAPQRDTLRWIKAHSGQPLSIHNNCFGITAPPWDWVVTRNPTAPGLGFYGVGGERILGTFSARVAILLGIIIAQERAFPKVLAQV